MMNALRVNRCVLLISAEVSLSVQYIWLVDLTHPDRHKKEIMGVYYAECPFKGPLMTYSK